MLLRESGTKSGRTYDLHAVTDDHADPGVADASHLRALTEAVIQGRWGVLDALCDAALVTMSPTAITDVLSVAAAFNGITRVADATGIPLDAATHANTVELRRATGIDAFEYDAKSLRYSR